MLEIVMDRLKAQELLEDYNYSGRLSMVGLYNLLMRAGYSHSESHKVAMQRGWSRLDAGEKM